jgi:hypothetical protein
MRRERVYSIRGKAIDTDTAAPASGRSVLDAIPAPASASSIVSVSPQGSAKVGPDGSFELRNLRPGHHILQVLGAGMMWVVYGAANEIVSFSEGRSEGFSGGRSTGRLDVTITDSDVNDVVLQLVEGATLSGKVTWEDSLKSWGSRPNVRLVPNDGNTLNTPLGPIEADGTFEIEGIAPMKYSVYFGGLPAGIVVKSIRLRGEDVTGLLLDLTSGAGGSLEIVLSSK